MNPVNRENDDAARAADSRLVHDFGLLIKAATRLELRIDTALRKECEISHTMFEVLIRLCRHPAEEISQRRLADDLTLTSSGITRLIDRMEGAGLVRRAPAPGTAEASWSSRPTTAVRSSSGPPRSTPRSSNGTSWHRWPLPTTGG